MTSVPAGVPAHDLEAEKAVLGALLLRDDPRIVLRLLSRGLEPNSFYREQHGLIFKASVSMARRQVGIDPITLVAEMQSLQMVEGDIDRLKAYVDELTSWVHSTNNIVFYADRVIEQARWRQRRVACFEMLEAVNALDEEHYEQYLRVLSPPVPDEMAGPSIIRLVNEAGEVVGEQMSCDACEKHKDQIKSLEKDLRTKRARISELERDREQDARESGWWMDCIRLFEMWKQLSGHARSPFTADRFFEAEPFLKRREHGYVRAAQAIVGQTFDPFKTKRKNGTTKSFDEWGRIFKDADSFEEACSKAPQEGKWRESLTPEVRRAIGERERQGRGTRKANQNQLRVAT